MSKINFYRMVTLLEHIPWLAGFLAMVPAFARDFSDLKKARFHQAAARKETGNKRRDLFYHLVLSVHLPFVVGIQG